MLQGKQILLRAVEKDDVETIKEWLAGGRGARSICRTTPGAAAKIVASNRFSRSGSASTVTPAAGINAVAPTVQGSISPVPSV